MTFRCDGSNCTTLSEQTQNKVCGFMKLHSLPLGEKNLNLALKQNERKSMDLDQRWAN